MKVKKMMILSLASVMGTMSFAGCGDKQTSPKPEMPVYETTERFRIGNWGVPPHENTGYKEYEHNPDYCNVDEWTKLKDCGFNLAVPTGGFTIEEILRDLEMADAVGMKVLVRNHTKSGLETIINYAKDQGLDYDQTRAELDKRSEEIKADIDKFKAHKSFAGVNAYDEPSMDYFEPIAACQDWFLKNYPDYEFYTNLLPVYAMPRQLYGSKDGKGYDYNDYVSMYAKEVNPARLSYDHYPILRDWDESVYIKEDFLYNLNIFARQAKKVKVPVDIYLQTMGFFNNVPITKYEEFAWQAYTSLAFGVRGILCFQYWTQLQAEYHHNVRGGIVDRDGTITPLYYAVQKVFNEIKAMQDVYMHFKWDDLKTHEGGRFVNDMFSMVTGQAEKLAKVKNISSEEDIVVGQFIDDEGNYAYMVTNATLPFDPITAKVELTFSDEFDWIMVIKKGERSIVELSNHKVNMEIGSGEGYFVVPLK